MHLIFHDNLFGPNRLVYKKLIKPPEDPGVVDKDTGRDVRMGPFAALRGMDARKKAKKKPAEVGEKLADKADKLKKDREKEEKKAKKEAKEKRKGLKRAIEHNKYIDKVRGLLKDNPEAFHKYVMDHLPHTYKKGEWKGEEGWNSDFGKLLGVNKGFGKYVRSLQKILKYEKGIKTGVDGQLGKGTVRALSKYLCTIDPGYCLAEGGKEGEETPPPFEFTPEQWEFIKPYYWPYVTMLDVTGGLHELNIPKATSQKFAKAFYACMETAYHAGLMPFRPNNVHSWQNVFEHLISNSLITENYLNIVYPSILETFTQEEYKKELEHYKLKDKKQKEEERETGKEINIFPGDKAGSKEAIEEKDAGVEGDLSTSLKYDLFKESKIGYATMKNRLLQACRTAYQGGGDIKYDMFEKLPQGHVKTKYSTYKRLNKKWKEKWTEYKKVKKKLGPTKRLEFNKDIKDARKKRDDKIEEMYDMIEAKFSAHNERIERFTNNHDLPSEFVPQAAYVSKVALEKKIPAGVSIDGVLKLITNKGRKRIFKNFGELIEGTYKEATDLFAVNKLAKDSPKKLLNAINAAILIRNIDKYLDTLGGINIFN